MTSLDTDVWERFRALGKRAPTPTPTPTPTPSLNVSAWDAAREESAKKSAEAWEAGSGTPYAELLKIVDTTRSKLTESFGEQCTNAYVGRALAMFGAKCGGTNRTYATEDRSLPELSEALRLAGVQPVEGIIYQYCDLCAVVEAFYTAAAEAHAAIIGRTGKAPVYLVDDFSDCGVRVNGQFVSLTGASVAMYAHHFHHGHADACWGGGMTEQHLRSGHGKYTDSLKSDDDYHKPDSAARVKLSRLVRTPRLPTKNIDIDVLCVDPASGAPIALVEESSSIDKQVNMTVNVARVLRAPYVVAVKTRKVGGTTKIFEGAAVHDVGTGECTPLPARSYKELSTTVAENMAHLRPEGQCSIA